MVSLLPHGLFTPVEAEVTRAGVINLFVYGGAGWYLAH